VLARARQDRDDAEQEAEVVGQLTDAGVRVIEAPLWTDPAKPLGWQVRDSDGTEYTTETHAGCEGHVAWAEAQWVSVDDQGTVYTSDDLDTIEHGDPERFEALDVHRERRWMPVYGCDDPTRLHARASGDTAAIGEALDLDGDGAASAQDSGPSRRVVIENNKAWDAATRVRRAWLREFFQRKTAPAGAAAFIALAIVNREYLLRKAMEQGHDLAVELFGVEGASKTDVDEDGYVYPPYRRAHDLATLTDGATDKRLTHITLAVIMAAYENVLDRQSWRRDGGCTEEHYLRYLNTLGYQLSDVERLAAGLEPGDFVV
jgi:ParB family chromosome partitioning protein